MRALLIWAALCTAIAVPIIAAAFSPLLAWREPIYIAAGFAGIVGMALMLLQPLLIGGRLPGIRASDNRRLHLWIGVLVVTAVVLHVAGLWITSPPDVIDVLLFRSPAPFGIWGALAMWAVFVSAALGLWRVHGRPQLHVWRIAHTACAILIVSGTILHAAMIEGTMHPLTKLLLGAVIFAATLHVIIERKAWARLVRQRKP
ncbi:MAG: ferric reductase-like transmembrane domain-containing protein [Dinoroseobacter sp.]|nr:ferric reductase-like transmembrane domain-containing protein [Dinoroseobacter sp.]